jgi:toxin secretion/phage lysis holin
MHASIGLKAAAALLYTAAMSRLYGDSLAVITMYVTFILLDYVTGVIAAIINRKANSRTSLNGVLRKLQGVIAVSFGHFLDVYCHIPNDMAQTTFALMLCGTEVISIVENLTKSGVRLPAWVTELGSRMISQADTDPTNGATISTTTTTSTKTVNGETHIGTAIETVVPKTAVGDSEGHNGGE